jgi:hypothetical protein
MKTGQIIIKRMLGAVLVAVIVTGPSVFEKLLTLDHAAETPFQNDCTALDWNAGNGSYNSLEDITSS